MPKNKTKTIMEKMKNKRTGTRLFNGLLGERRVNFLYGTLLCLLLLVPANSLRAQSNDSILIVFEKVPVDDECINKEGLPERDLELEAILPTAMYDVSNENLLLFSQHVTFDSVTYYIMDEANLVSQQSEIALPKGVEIEISLVSLLSGTYRIVLDFEGNFFYGYFYVE